MEHLINTKVVILAAAKALPVDDLPGAILTNDHLSELMGQVRDNLSVGPNARSIEISDAEFPFVRIGISARRVLDEYFTTRDLACIVGQKLLHGRNDTDKIRAVIVTTVTPDRIVPNIACGVQEALGLNNGVVPVQICVGCSGSVAALETAARMLSGFPVGAQILVIGADTMTHVLDASDRGTCVIFGDGAGAVLLARAEDTEDVVNEASNSLEVANVDPLHAPKPNYSNYWQIKSAESYVVGAKGDLIEIRTDPVNCEPMYRFVSHDGETTVALDHQNHNRVYMDGRSVYKDMIRLVPARIKEHLAQMDLTPADIDVWLFHQANGRMIESIGKCLGISESSLRINIDKIGNTTNGAIPILLADELKNRPNVGRRMMMVGFGTGYALGIIYLERP